jgi:hypothetical protein
VILGTRRAWLDLKFFEFSTSYQISLHVRLRIHLTKTPPAGESGREIIYRNSSVDSC